MSPQDSAKILIADDETSITEGLAAMLELEGFKATVANDGETALRLLQEDTFDLLLVDLMMPGKSGLDVLHEVKKSSWPVEVIIITGKGSIDTAVQAIKSGAYDFLTKPVDPSRLKAVIPKALEYQNLRRTNKKLQLTIARLSGYDEMVGQHDKIRHVYKVIDAVADTAANVFITGESGTGKELVARAIHNQSGRREQPFIAVNCSAFPRDILENELFGHEKGAFTGAIKEKAGCFEMAHGGTLFLDEIGEMPADTQSKLLRVLEEPGFRRLGGSREIRVDVRIISATNRNVPEALKDGSLREDLYFRLAVMDIEVPALRERMSDLPLLLDTYLQKFNDLNNKLISGISPDCMEVLSRYHWPGNIRELKNIVERAVILCNDKLIGVEHLPKQLLTTDFSEPSPENYILLGKSFHEIEKEVIYKTLQMTGNNKTKAAQLLQISLKTMHNKLNKYLAEDA